MKSMKALILIGGEGTRLRPLTLNTLKTMVPIANKKFFEYQFQILKKYKIKNLILSICYMPEKIKHIIGSGKKYGLNIKYVIEEKPLGTGGAIKNAEPFLDENTLVLNGDILTDVNLKELVTFHKKNNAIATLTLHEVADPTSYGLVQTDEKSRIINFLEKPNWSEVTTKWINAGIYIFNKKILKYIPENKNYSLERGVFPKLVENKEIVVGYKSDSYWIDIGTIDKYMKANFDILEKKFKIPYLSRKAIGVKIQVGKKTHVSLRSFLRGPIIIGDFCKVEKCSLKPLTIIGNHCEIEKNSYIEKSIIWDNVKIGENATIINCIIGKNCEIQSNVILQNAVIGDGTKITQYSKIIEAGVL